MNVKNQGSVLFNTFYLPGGNVSFKAFSPGMAPKRYIDHERAGLDELSDELFCVCQAVLKQFDLILKNKYYDQGLKIAVKSLQFLSYVFCRIHNLPTAHLYQICRADSKLGQGINEMWNQVVYYACYNIFNNFLTSSYDRSKDLYSTGLVKRVFYVFVNLQSPFFFIGDYLVKNTIEMIMYDIAAIVDMVTDFWNDGINLIDKHVLQNIGFILRDLQIQLHEKFSIMCSDIATVFERKRQNLEDEFKKYVNPLSLTNLSYNVHTKVKGIYEDIESLKIALSDTQRLPSPPDKSTLKKVNKRYSQAKSIVRLMEMNLEDKHCYSEKETNTSDLRLVAQNGHSKSKKDEENERFTKHIKLTEECKLIITTASRTLNNNYQLLFSEIETANPSNKYFLRHNSSLRNNLSFFDDMKQFFLSKFHKKEEARTRKESRWAREYAKNYYVSTLAIEGTVLRQSKARQETLAPIINDEKTLAPIINDEKVIKTQMYDKIDQNYVEMVETLAEANKTSNNNSTDDAPGDFLINKGIVLAMSFFQIIGQRSVGNLAFPPLLQASEHDEQEPLDEYGLLEKFDTLFA
jgi:hypothetical protein